MKSTKIFFLLSFFLILPIAAHSQYAQGNIFAAARSGDIITIQNLLNTEKLDKETLNMALGAAVVGDQVKIIKFLLKAGADPNHKSSYNNPLLINAIVFDKFLAAETLIKEGADVNSRGYNRIMGEIHISRDWTPLMCAVYKGNLSLIKILISKGANINEKGWSRASDDLETAADIAAYSGQLEILKFLLSNKAEMNPETIFKVASIFTLATTAEWTLLGKVREIINIPSTLNLTLTYSSNGSM